MTPHDTTGALPAELRDRVVAVVDEMEGEIVELASRLVRIPSVAPNYPGVDNDSDQVRGGEAACNRVLADVMAGFGCDVASVEVADGRPNVVGVLAGTGVDGGRSLVMNGHVDVVPYGRLDDWDRDPVSGDVAEGRIWGRGACDMKGPVAGMIKAAEALHRSGVRLRGDVILQSVVGEEVGEFALGTQAVLDAGYTGDAAISAEPTVDIRDGTLDVEIISCRAVLLKLTVLGKATHVGFRNELIHAGGLGDAIGVSAIEKAIFVMDAIARLEGNWARVSRPPFPAGKFVLHPGVIRGGPSGVEIPYFVSDHCTIDYSVWFDPSRTHESIQAEIEAFVLRACSLDPWLAAHPPQFAWYDQYGHHEIAPDAPLVKAVAASHRAVAGTDVRLRAGYASGDGVVLFESGVPTLVYGPGNLARAHAANEYIAIAELITATKVWALTMAEWCGID